MPDKIWLNEPIATEREISVRLYLGGVGVPGMLNSDCLVKIAKPGANALTDAVCTVTEVTGFADAKAAVYRLRLSPGAVSVDGDVEYEITDALGLGRFDPTHGYVPVAIPETSQLYGQAVGGGPGYVLLPATAVAQDNYYASATSPAVAIIVQGKGAGQARIANGYTGANQQLAVTPNWTVGDEPDNTSIVRVIPLTGSASGGGGGGVAIVDNQAVATAVWAFVLDALAPAKFQTPQQVMNVLAAWLAGIATGFPPTVQQQLAYQSVGDPTKTRLAGAVSGGARDTTTVDGT